MENKVIFDTIWVLVTAMLVFFMNLGFAMVESGFSRSKNAVNILSKNFIVFAVSSLAFWVLGWGLMFGDGNDIFGLSGLFGMHGSDNSPATGDAYSSLAMSWQLSLCLQSFSSSLSLLEPPPQSYQEP
jgi:Amt family ammonium transporter